MLKSILVLSNFILIPQVFGHVGLTFPPARKFDLDFMDTIRTVGPCGMEKGSIKTSVEAGKPLKVTWHLGYPHKGGYLLELLDNKGQPLQNLTEGYQGLDNKYAQEATVTLPAGLTCPDCTIRLQRQAEEWGPTYRFWSCADVDIVGEDTYSKTCSNLGSPTGSGCACPKTYFGDECQYKNDCETEADCHNHGQCIDHEGTSLPKKECYCQIGYYGQTCDKISPLNSKSYNASYFRTIELLPGNVKFLWRFVDLDESEMEGIVVAKTKSYVALGWRPSDLTKSCQKFPTSVPAPKGTDFHAMDCQDIVIGKVKGELSNIGDYYTRDRSTPRRDEFYGGTPDLTGAVGWEEDGTTTIWFRKKVDQSDKADHEFYGSLKLIWAHGRSDDSFFADDELKYHGGNKGSYILPFASSAPSTIIPSFFILVSIHFVAHLFA